MAIDRRFQEKALRLADEVGVEKAAAELRIPPATLLKWRQNISPRPVIPVLSHVQSPEKDPLAGELRRTGHSLRTAKGFPGKPENDTN